MNTHGESEIKIESGIPIPGLLLPKVKQMKIGDSFVLPIKRRTYPGCLAVRLGIKFTTRKISKTEIRVWRIA